MERCFSADYRIPLSSPHAATLSILIPADLYRKRGSISGINDRSDAERPGWNAVSQRIIGFRSARLTRLLCQSSSRPIYIGSGAAFPELTIDLTQSGRDGTLFLSGLSDSAQLASRGYFVNPHPGRSISEAGQHFRN